MLQLLQPCQYVANIHCIDFAQLKRLGIKAICSDLDNTLVPWSANQVNPELLDWIDKAQSAGFEVYLISNAVPKRFARFAELLGVRGIGKAGKPRKKAFLRALQELQLPAEQVALVGDQIFTDVLGGNRVGLYTILVMPLSKREFIGTRFMRRIESLVLRHLSLDHQA